LLIAKHLSDQLSVVAKSVDNEDLISYIVGGLNPIFTPFITFLNFATQDQPISFNAFQSELLNYEQPLEAQNKPSYLILLSWPFSPLNTNQLIRNQDFLPRKVTTSQDPS
jgi:hypothetical protein